MRLNGKHRRLSCNPIFLGTTSAPSRFTLVRESLSCRLLVSWTLSHPKPSAPSVQLGSTVGRFLTLVFSPDPDIVPQQSENGAYVKEKQIHMYVGKYITSTRCQSENIFSIVASPIFLAA